MRVRLKQPIIIPAGTIMDDAPHTVQMAPGHVEYIVGLTPDSTGSLFYFLDPDDPALTDWFEVLDVQGSARPCRAETVRQGGWIRRQVYGEV